MSLQADDKIVQAGNSDAADARLLLARLLADGSLDTTYVNGGVGTYAVTGGVR